MKNTDLSPLTRLGAAIIAVIAVRAVFIFIARGMAGGYSVNMVLTSVASFVIPLVVFYQFLKPCLSTEDKKDRPDLYRALIYIPLLFFLANAGGVITEAISAVIGVPVETNVYESMMPQNVLETVMFYTLAAIAAPIAEELIFRKIILEPLRKLGDSFAVIISAACFALFHGNFTQLLYAFFCGVLLGYVSVIFGTVKASVIIHMFYNISVVILYSAGSAAAFVINSLLSLIGACTLIYIISKQKDNKKLFSVKKETVFAVLKNQFLMLGFILLFLSCFGFL